MYHNRFSIKLKIIEVSYSIFVYSGMLKSVLGFYDIFLPLDFTILSFLCLITSVFFNLNDVKVVLNTENGSSILFLFLFTCTVILSLVYSPSSSYKIEKTLQFQTNFIVLILPLFIINFDYKIFIKCSILINVLLVLWYFNIDLNSSKLIRDTFQFNVFAQFYLPIATLTGINFLYLYMSDSIFKLKTLLTLFLIGSLFLLRARGPLIFTLLILLLNFRLKNIKLKFKKIYLLYIPSIGILFFIFHKKITYLISNSLYRLSLLFDGLSKNKTMGASVEHRMSNISDSINLIFDNGLNFLFGYGFGSYGILTLGKDVRSYPHNVFLEVWVELGFVGAVVFLLFIGNIFILSKKSFSFSFFVMLFIFFNMMKSSSISDMRIYFAFMSMMIITIKK